MAWCVTTKGTKHTKPEPALDFAVFARLAVVQFWLGEVTAKVAKSAKPDRPGFVCFVAFVVNSVP